MTLRPRTTSPRRHGFTLLELLLAMTMTAIIAGSLYAALRIGFRAEAAAEAAVEPARTADLAMGLLRPDFESAVAPSAAATSGVAASAASGTGALRGAFTGTDQSGDGGLPADTLEFYTLGDPVDPAAWAAANGTGANGGTPGLGGLSGTSGGMLGSRGTASGTGTTSGSGAYASGLYAGFVPGAGEVRMVDLFVTRNPTGNVLIRRVTTNLLSSTTPAYYDEVVCRGVRSFNLRYYDGAAWADSWDSTLQDNNSPTAVEVTLELQRGDADQPRVLRFTRVFLLSCSGLWSTSAATGTTTGTTGGTGQ